MPESYNKGANGRWPKRAGAIAVAGMLAVSGTTGAQALTPNVVAEVTHFVECFGWMITDPVTHEDQCLPAREQPLGSLVDTGPGDPAAPPPPAPPPTYPGYPT